MKPIAVDLLALGIAAATVFVAVWLLPSEWEWTPMLMRGIGVAAMLGFFAALWRIDTLMWLRHCAARSGYPSELLMSKKQSLRPVKDEVSMYQYPNGLKCAAPAARVRAFEAIVPSLVLVAIIVGCGVIAASCFDRHEVLWSSTVVGWACAAWIVLCTWVAFKVFQVWCKPLLENNGTQRKRS